jgi:hypothetical protein
MAVYNERSGQIGNLPIPKKDYFENKNPEEDLDIMKKELEKFNREQWKRQIESVFVNSTRVNREIGGAIESADEGEQKIKEINPEYSGSIFEVYKEYEKDYDSYKKDIDTIAKEMCGKSLMPSPKSSYLEVGLPKIVDIRCPRKYKIKMQKHE